MKKNNKDIHSTEELKNMKTKVFMVFK